MKYSRVETETDDFNGLAFNIHELKFNFPAGCKWKKKGFREYPVVVVAGKK